MSFSKLDRGRIVDEALALLQEEGLAQVSLRKVAARLGVGVSSLYWHVKDRDALYGLMSHTVFRSCLLATPAAETWQQWLKGFGRALWDAQSSVRDARQLIVVATIDEQARSAVRDEIVGELTQRRLDPALAILAQRSVQALVTGWTTLRLRPTDTSPAESADFVCALDVLIMGWSARAAADAIPA